MKIKQKTLKNVKKNLYYIYATYSECLKAFHATAMQCLIVWKQTVGGAGNSGVETETEICTSF